MRLLVDTCRICSTVDAASAHVSHQAAGTGDPGKRSGEIGTPQQEAIDLNLTPVHEAFLAGAFALMPATDGALPESTCR